MCIRDRCEVVVVTHEEHVSVMTAFVGSGNVVEYPVSLTAYETGLGDVVMGPGNVAVFFSGSGSQWDSHVRCIKLTTGNITQCGNCGINWFSAPQAVLHPNHKWIIASSQGLHKLEFIGDCVTHLSQSSFRVGVANPLVSYSGTRLFGFAGSTYSIDLTGTDDFQYHGSFYSTITFDRFESFAQSPLYPYNIYAMKEDEENLIVYR